MARITIEDCMEKVPNRFQLVQMAAIRAKQLKRGAHAFLDKDENKEVVTALREIADGIVKPDISEVPEVDPRFVTRISPSAVEALHADDEPVAVEGSADAEAAAEGGEAEAVEETPAD
ncbi:MAG: DNA-directed RNA polymerase subunit omega [Myxococcota bacterium]|jgi:DNA-directed RNA polymerase subunit omega|nr:DNA-directed RNA polymerase subunit omega [Myxococcota bacterium]